METRCLICESMLVVTKAQAQVVSLLLGTLGGFLDGCSEMHVQNTTRIQTAVSATRFRWDSNGLHAP
jgi:hypothetical protein